MSKAEDLLTVSIGPERKAWVKANAFPASKALQSVIDAKRDPSMPARVRLRPCRGYTVRAVVRPGLVIHARTVPPSKEWDKLRAHMWVARAPADQLGRFIAEAADAGRVVTTVKPYVLLMAVRPAEVSP